MTRMSAVLTISLVASAISACSPQQDTSVDPDTPVAETPIPVEPDGGIGDGAGPPENLSTSQEDGEAEEPSAFEQTFPVAIRGKWRETTGAAVTAAQCDGYQADNMGKVLTVREDSYSYFETGGRFIAIDNREPGRIRAVFDTTYADEPTRDELEFRVDPVARTLTVRNFDSGEQETVTYRRCPRA